MINNINNINRDFYHVSSKNEIESHSENHEIESSKNEIESHFRGNRILLYIGMNRLTKLLTQHKINIRNWARFEIKPGKYNTTNISSWRSQQENQAFNFGLDYLFLFGRALIFSCTNLSKDEFFTIISKHEIIWTRHWCSLRAFAPSILERSAWHL